MQHSLFFKALFAVVALGLYNFYSSKWSPPLDSWTSEFVERQTASNLTYYAFSGQLEQSVGDTRKHQLIKLPNNMVVLCTSDPDSADSAASLSVNIGSMADPKEFPGMAHFLEHMLFLGSAKYPTENEYAQYIDNNMGHWSAATAMTETTYYFSIANPAFEADIMKLTVAGNHSVEQLIEWTVEKFSQVESKGNTKLKYEGHPLDQNALGKLVHMETISNINGISLQFALPDIKSMYLANPTTYISSLLSIESPGSL
ncbi:metalloprotease [Coemansia sp. RSA 1972]|nr:metalloprotease [Coemansia sp. RSA 1972]